MGTALDELVALLDLESIEVTFPFWQSGTSAPGSGPTGKLSLTLTYDVNTKTLTAAAGSITAQ